MPKLLLGPEIKTRSFLGSHHIQVYRTLLMNVWLFSVHAEVATCSLPPFSQARTV